MVSIIIPVYNVEKYLRKCLDSVIRQTHQDLEIILINDGSTDNSGEICLELANSDSRVIYVSKKNEGLGPTRNFGVKIASGDYIAFIDSDDWYDERYIEMMYLEAEKTNADIVVCGYYEYDDGYGKITGTYYPDFASEAGGLLAAPVVIWLKLFRKGFFLNHKIEMPNCPGEDMAVSGFIMANAKKASIVWQTLYYYRTNRFGSIMSNYKKHAESIIYFLSYHCELFKRDNIFEKYKDRLLIYSLTGIRGCRDNLNRIGGDYRSLFENIKGFLNSYFPGWEKMYNLKISCCGSYSLYFAVYRFMPVDSEKIYEFCFSGLISIMSPKAVKQAPPSNNSFRTTALLNDLNKSFIERCKVANDDFIVIDFMDERFDILQFDNGGYCTFSDALAETEIDSDFKILNRWDSDTISIWHKKCLDYISMLRKCFSPDRVILVKNRLAEYYGESGKEYRFNNFEEIRLVNSNLDACYSFFESNFPGIFVIDPVGIECCYTFKYFRHGCHPWHYNNEYYIEIADAVENYLKRML